MHMTKLIPLTINKLPPALLADDFITTISTINTPVDVRNSKSFNGGFICIYVRTYI